MPKLRRLNGKEIISILENFGFEVIRIKGSHHRLRRTVEGTNQYLTVALHGSKSVSIGTLQKIYRQATTFISEEELNPHFYAD